MKHKEMYIALNFISVPNQVQLKKKSCIQSCYRLGISKEKISKQ